VDVKRDELYKSAATNERKIEFETGKERGSNNEQKNKECSRFGLLNF